ncbi:MAG: protein-disulfide reductase DsbD domain-containing protein [Bacteroidota bacterium]
MKNFIAILFCMFSVIGLKAQTQNPVTWQAIYKIISASEGEVVITAKIEKGWHTYSQHPTETGPIPTSFKFTETKQYQLVGKIEESNAHEEFVKAFDAKIFVFQDKAEFKQKIKLSGTKGADIVVNVEFMCCNDMMCLPPKKIELTVKAQ